MKCPACAHELTRKILDLPYTYKGFATIIPSVNAEHCAQCGEAVMDTEESTRVSAAMLKFNKQVNASIIDPEFIATVRRKLDLDQREAGEIFGGGVNAFSRYETPTVPGQTSASAR
jgi:HTH-type transcriptional regulator/antitoxin MqsA